MSNIGKEIKRINKPLRIKNWPREKPIPIELPKREKEPAKDV